MERLDLPTGDMEKKSSPHSHPSHRFQDEWLTRAALRLPQVTKEQIGSFRKQKGLYLSQSLLQAKVCTPRQLGKAVLEEYNIPFVYNTDHDINKHALSLIPEKVCRTHKLFPLRLQGNLLEIVMANPLDADALELAQEVSGRHVSVAFSLPEVIDTLIAKYYANRSVPHKTINNAVRRDAPIIPVLMEPAPAGKEKILLADDNNAMRLLLRMVLEKRGFAVEEAENGETALEKAASIRPDLIILDLNMPRLNGRDVLKHLQQKSPVCPVIVLTSDSDEAVHEEMLTLGADDFLVKPFKPNLLLSRIKTTLRRTEK